MSRRLIRPGDAEWPTQLQEPTSHDAPRKLHLEGRPLEMDFTRTVAIVGARYPTAAGVETARTIARGLAEAEFTIVSGLAMGIDSAAHRACLEVDGYTIAVLGTGLDVVYPGRNAALRKQILERGTLVTEYPNDMPPIAGNFPRRNRIIAGLSKAVVFVEGGHKSGGKITAKIAFDMERTVYAVPGSVRNPMAAGPNELIKNQTASLITGFTDVLRGVAPEIAWNELRSSSPSSPIQLEENDRTVIFLLEETPLAPEKIRRYLDLPLGKVALILARLEARGWVVRKPAGFILTESGFRTRELATLDENV